MVEKHDVLNFRISSGLKNLIGKELITDQFIAIFELVKNSFDAGARMVTIFFKDLKKTTPTIIIADNGCGMNYLDLNDKWLFVAYSEKKLLTNAENLKDSDYRDKIKSKRIFAGAKGVGRFSCDRLGSKLTLTTKKDELKAKVENLTIDWDDFEKDSLEEFVQVKVKHQTLKNIPNNYLVGAEQPKSGTFLEIGGLREVWDRDSILKLKRSLEKLINPNQGNDSRNFTIKIVAEEELEHDNLQKKERDKVNGNVSNTIFENLELKTTQVVCEISNDGKILTTTLVDRGTLIYKLTEKNQYFLHDINIHLFQLNQVSKSSFTKLMGMEPVKYGSVFIFKNGFRIYPYGEPGEDFLSIDKRKAQGYNRYLGTRDLIGRIEINGNNESLKETTSRDGGLIKNKKYQELQAFFYEKALKRLERYVIEVIKWGDPYKLYPGDSERRPALNPEDVKDKIKDIIGYLVKTKEIKKLEYNKDFLQIIEKKQDKSLTSSLKSFLVQADMTDDIELKKRATLITREVKDLLLSKTQIQEEADQKEKELRQASVELKRKVKQNLFLKSVTSLDLDNIVTLHHQIGLYANDIDAQILFWNRRVNKGKSITQNEMRDFLSKIGFLTKKILSVTRFATKANFNMQSEEIVVDLISFIEEYIENIYINLSDYPLNITVTNPSGNEFITKFKPIEVTIIIDNLINNSRKAKSRNIKIVFETQSTNFLKITFVDDGSGLDKSIKEINEIFEKGFTTTSGSGLGLYHVTEVLRSLNGSIRVKEDEQNGAHFIIEVRK